MLSRVGVVSSRAIAPSVRCVRAVVPRSGALLSSISSDTGVATEPQTNHPPFPSDAYRRSPFDPTIFLYERSVKEMYQNIQHLASEGNRPKVDAFHRLLLRVQTSRDVDFALSALTLCRTRFVEFTNDTASLFVAACIRAGRLDTAADVLRRSTTYRLWPTRSAFHRLMVAAAEEGDVDTVQETFKVLKSSVYVKPNARTYYIACRALVSVGHVEEALALWKEGSDDGVANIGSNGVNSIGALCLGIVGSDVTPSRDLVQPVLDAASSVTRPSVSKLVNQVQVAIADAEASGGGDADDSEVAEEPQSDGEGEGESKVEE